MYCTHCGTEFKKSWRMPSHCRSCGHNVSYEPRGLLSVLLVISLVAGALVGWLTDVIFDAIDAPGGQVNLFGHTLAPLLAVLAILVAYLLVGRIFVQCGVLKSKDLSAEKPTVTKAPTRRVKLTTQQQIALNLHKVEVDSKKRAQAAADSDGKEAAPASKGVAPSSATTHRGVVIGAAAGMGDYGSRGVSPSSASASKGVALGSAAGSASERLSFGDAFRASRQASRKAAEEQYSGEAHREAGYVELPLKKEGVSQGKDGANGTIANAAAVGNRAATGADFSASAQQATSVPGKSTVATAPSPANNAQAARHAGFSTENNVAAPTSLPAASRGGHTGTYDEVRAGDEQGIREMGELACSIVKKHFDPIIGPEQNDYMIALFNTAKAISQQISEQGYRYFFVCDSTASASASAHERHIGFIAFYPRALSEKNSSGQELYLSKFYLRSDKRGQGLSHDMCRFVVDHARALGCSRVVLNVNRNNYQAILAYEHLGFQKIGEKKTDIGDGYVMDDLVYALPVA